MNSMTRQKRCTICGERQDETEFRFRSRKNGKRRSECRTCAATRARIAYRRDPSKPNANSRRTYHKQKAIDPVAHARQQHDNQLRVKFGITLEQYDAMVQVQNNRCAICGQLERVRRQTGLLQLAVDHDHKTGQVRGLLCSHCNQAIGKMQDSPQQLRKAAAYLEYHYV